jgi:hypothetical protein
MNCCGVSKVAVTVERLGTCAEASSSMMMSYVSVLPNWDYHIDLYVLLA